MRNSCPVCNSTNVHRVQTARRICSTVGAIGGAATGVGGAEIGAAVGAVGGPAVIFIGGLLGGAAGTRLGDTLDDRVLGNFECADCGHVFSEH